MMDKQLKPCPCCGGTAIVNSVRQCGKKEPGAWIECEKCSIQTKICRCRSVELAMIAARSLWNVRTKGETDE